MVCSHLENITSERWPTATGQQQKCLFHSVPFGMLLMANVDWWTHRAVMIEDSSGVENRREEETADKSWSADKDNFSMTE